LHFALAFSMRSMQGLGWYHAETSQGHRRPSLRPKSSLMSGGGGMTIAGIKIISTVTQQTLNTSMLHTPNTITHSKVMLFTIFLTLSSDDMTYDSFL